VRHQPPHHRQVLVHDGHVQHALTFYMKKKHFTAIRIGESAGSVFLVKLVP
jgi:hypothetical protein